MKINEAMLTVVRHLRNAFEVSVERGDFVISDGRIALYESYSDNEWIAITGSKFNNGIYQLKVVDNQYLLGNGTDDEKAASDEYFTGSVWRLLLPRDFITVCGDLLKWFESPAGQPTTVVSESVVGFYTKTNATNRDGAPVGWDKVFATRLSGSWREMYASELVRSL
jgi:hypothetical protein